MYKKKWKQSSSAGKAKKDSSGNHQYGYNPVDLKVSSGRLQFTNFKFDELFFILYFPKKSKNRLFNSFKLILTVFKKYLALEKIIAINQGSSALCSVDELDSFTKIDKVPPGYGPVYPVDSDRQLDYLYLRKTTFHQFGLHLNPENFKRYLIHIYTLGGALVEPGNPVSFTPIQLFWNFIFLTNCLDQWNVLR